MAKYKLRPPAPALTDPAVGDWAAKVPPQPAPTETRVERQWRMEKRLHHDHFDQVLEGRSRFHSEERIPAGCPECEKKISWFTYSLSGYWQPPKPAVPRGFTR